MNSENCKGSAGLFIGDDIGSGLSSMDVCFNFLLNQRSAAQY